MKPNAPKVLHFIESAGVYGAENVVLNLSKEMMIHQEYFPIIGCILQNLSHRNKLCEKATSLGIHALPVVIQNCLIPVGLIKAAQMLKRNGISLIHSHGYKPAVFGFLLSRLTGIPIIGTCHLWFSHQNSTNRYLLMTRLEHYIYRYFKYVIAVSHEIIEKLKISNIPIKRIKLIHNGIEVMHRSESIDVEKTRKEFGINNAYPIVGNVGRLVAQKGQINIIHAAKILIAKGCLVNFVIAGEGELREAIQKEINRSGISNYVKLVGFQDDIFKLYNVSDIFLLTSVNEGMPLSLLEAVYAKVPIVSTAVGEIQEIVENGKDGILIPKNNVNSIVDSIEWCIRNREIMLRMALNAYVKFAGCFSRISMYNAYKTLYSMTLH